MSGKFVANFLLILSALCLSGQVSAREMVNLPDEAQNGKSSRVWQKDVIDISHSVSFFEDKTARMSLDDVLKIQDRFTPNKMIRPIFGFSRSAIWAGFTIDPGRAAHPGVADRGTAWNIFYDNALQENLDFYIEDQQNPGSFREVRTGLRAGRANRNFFTAKVSVPLEIKPGNPFRVFVRVRTIDDVVEIPLFLHTEEGQRYVTNQQSLFQGFYYGVIIVVFLYNLFIFFTVRDRNYLFYCFYVITTGLIFSSHHGRLSYLFGDDYRLYRIVLNTLLVVSPVFAVIFSRGFLQTRQSLPRADFLLKVVLGLLVFFGIFASVANHYPIQYYFVVLVTGCALLLGIGIYLYRKYSYARIYTHAWAVYLGMLILYSMRSLNIHFPFSNYGMELGGIIEAVLLSFALADRIRYLQKEQRQFGLLQRDLAMATEIQKYLFPGAGRSNRLGREQTGLPYSIAGRYIPSSSLSGDFYDYLADAGGNLSLLMVDVAGHGYAAGLVASMIKVAFRETLPGSRDLREHQQRINRILYDNVSNTFATALNLKIEPGSRRLSVVSSGHMPLLHYRSGSEIGEYSPPGLPLGVKRDYGCEVLTVGYGPGDRLVIFTDGIIEERSPTGEEYGMDRLKEKIRLHARLGAEEFADELMADMVGWKGGREQEDDITFIVLDLH